MTQAESAFTFQTMPSIKYLLSAVELGISLSALIYFSLRFRSAVMATLPRKNPR